MNPITTTGRTGFASILLLIFSSLMSFNSNAQTPLSAAEMFVFRLLPGQDLKTEIEKKVKENNWKAVAIVSCVGSLESASIRFANQKEAAKIPGSLEIVSLTGTLGSGGTHIHISVSDSSGKTSGGHLMPGCPVYTTAEIVLAVLKNVVFDRETDPTYGFKELVVKPETK
jgi:predicted DNA-binding protein with PD1-like motif